MLLRTHLLVAPRTRWLRRWNTFLLQTVLWTSYVVPLEVAFHHSLDIVFTRVLKALGTVIDACFWCDMALTFRRSFRLPETNELVLDGKRIGDASHGTSARAVGS